LPLRSGNLMAQLQPHRASAITGYNRVRELHHTYSGI